MKLFTILLNSLLIIFVTFFLAACGLVPPAKPDAITGKLFTTSEFQQKDILTADKINLKQYKFLAVQGESFKYIGGTLKNMSLPLDVVTPNEFGDYLVKQGYSSQYYDLYEMTNQDIKTLYKDTGLHYLVWDVHSLPFTVQREINIRVYDPIDNKTYFSARYTIMDGSPGMDYNAVLNAFAAWLKKNS